MGTFSSLINAWRLQRPSECPVAIGIPTLMIRFSSKSNHTTVRSVTEPIRFCPKVIFEESGHIGFWLCSTGLWEHNFVFSAEITPPYVTEIMKLTDTTRILQIAQEFPRGVRILPSLLDTEGATDVPRDDYPRIFVLPPILGTN